MHNYPEDYEQAGDRHAVKLHAFDVIAIAPETSVRHYVLGIVATKHGFVQLTLSSVFDSTEEAFTLETPCNRSFYTYIPKD